MTFKKWNTYLGWSVFLIATIVYFVTAEPTVSLWDCGEYITAAYKLEVGHPPGAPLFMVLGRLFSFFAAPENVAVWINRLSGLSSSLTILFMFWSVTMLGKKIFLNRKPELSLGDKIAVLASATVGALAYTFSESFWFSAVEGEVYAMASLFTAVVFWAILKWDEEMSVVQNGKLASNIYPDRWLLLIMFLLGLAIGVHLLGILVVPAIGYVIYFRYKKEVSVKGLLLTGVISIVVLGFIQEGVIPGSVWLASKFEVTFTNGIGLPFFSGTLFFFAAIVAAAVYLIRRARKTGNTLMYNITMGMIFLLIGYGSFAVIVIRSNANTPLDENDPENLVTLHSYLKREQYGSSPIFFGQHWNSEMAPREEWKDKSPYYLRRFTVIKNDQDVKGFKSEKAAQKFAQEIGGGATVEEKYWESNEGIFRENAIPTYSQTAFFPRMYSDQDESKIAGYKNWSGYDPKEDKGTEIGTDGQRLPTFGENLTYFFSYQVNWMYFRYFLWNFSGRQNDIQGHGDNMRGNWISGFSFIDNMRLGDQGENAPYFTTQNPSNNKFFFLPLILGIIGLVFHYYRAPKDAFVVTLVFLFTGLAIVVYLNQKPFEPRERDYAYAGSFYFFAMWIGLGVLALYEAFLNFGKEQWKKIAVVASAGLLFSIFLDFYAEVSFPNLLSWLVMVLIGGGALGLMYALRKALKSEQQGAIVAGIIGLFVPLIMGIQGWDDHDRSDKTSAHDLASNYLMSCGPNGILFTNGDNDTFPVWYMQEVEGKRTDVRVCNLSLMQTDWYTDQMKMKAYESEPLPIRFREDQILMNAGGTDAVYFIDLLNLAASSADKKIINNIIDMRLKENKPQAMNALLGLNATMTNAMSAFTAADANSINRLNILKQALSSDVSENLTLNIGAKYTAAAELFSSLRAGSIKAGSQDQIKAFQDAMTNFEKSWNYIDIDDAMAFVRDDANMITFQGDRPTRFFPSSGFILKVDAANAVKSGVISKDQKDDCLTEMRFDFSDKQAIQREQVMILDILANNDWKRGIYFSSPGGGDVSLALYRRRLLKQNGMNFELSPLADQASAVNAPEMYKNLMKTYSWGLMNKKGVLTDYYTRRHTEQYRQYFEILADDYLRQIEEAKQYKKAGPEYIAQMVATNRMPQKEADRLLELVKNSDKIEAENKKKAIELIDFSLKIMPPSMVIDHGEPRQGRDTYEMGGLKYQSQSDGSLHEYVRILFEAGATEKANKLGLELAGQLESIIDYFMKSDPRIAFQGGNVDDLFAAMDAYFKISIAAASSDSKGSLYGRTKGNINRWYNNDLKSQYKKLDDAAISNGESTRRSSVSGAYTRMKFKVQDHLDAMAVFYGLKNDTAAPPKPNEGGGGTPIDLNQLMQQQGQ